MTTVLERLTSIADGIQEIYPSDKVTIAISLPLDDIQELLEDVEDIRSGTIFDIMKTHGAAIVVSIRGMLFAIEEKKVDPNLN